MLSLCSRGFPPDAPVFPTTKTCMLGLSPVSTLDRGTGSESGVDSLGTALWLSSAPQGWVRCRDQISLYAVYVTSNIPLPLNNTAKISNFVNIHLCRAIWAVILEDSITSEAHIVKCINLTTTAFSFYFCHPHLLTRVSSPRPVTCGHLVSPCGRSSLCVRSSPTVCSPTNRSLRTLASSSGTRADR